METWKVTHTKNEFDWPMTKPPVDLPCKSHNYISLSLLLYVIPNTLPLTCIICLYYYIQKAKETNSKKTFYHHLHNTHNAFLYTPPSLLSPLLLSLSTEKPTDRQWSSSCSLKRRKGQKCTFTSFRVFWVLLHHSHTYSPKGTINIVLIRVLFCYYKLAPHWSHTHISHIQTFIGQRGRKKYEGKM